VNASARITEYHNTFSTFFFSNALRQGGNHRVIYNAVNGWSFTRER